VKQFLVLVLEMVGGSALGLILSVLVANQLQDTGAMVAEVGRLLGYVIGVPVGVYVVGKLLQETGSFLFTLLGAAMGAVFVWVLSRPLPPDMSGETATLTLAFLLSLFIIGPILATLAFNLSLERYST
jgi:hypothetical protein